MVLLKEAGVLLKEAGMLLKEAGVLLEDAEVFCFNFICVSYFICVVCSQNTGNILKVCNFMFLEFFVKRRPATNLFSTKLWWTQKYQSC